MERVKKSNNGFTMVELMVVIAVIGILSSVAIPKFLDASQKAKATEFPTQLTAIYTGELAYITEQSTYASTFANLKDQAGVDVASSTTWFTYSLSVSGSTAFTGTASVNSPGFGQVTTSDFATIDQTNSKFCTSALQRYCPSWK
ncbi:MAG TPA: prepilin-type N-terminal cleavage/methylation domain-containing protein [Chitinivibrionales bacterium]|nr:prepilin-type N-terminal cleavage/methylation domain-containing protein [Chitinivibrionales bacterium]